MIYDLSSFDLQQIIFTANQIGTQNTLHKLGLVPRTISVTKAKKQVGEKKFREWRRSGKIIPIKQGRSVYVDREKFDFLVSFDYLVQRLSHGIRIEEIYSMLESSFEYGGLPVIVAYGLNKEQISQAEAYKVYGRKRVSFLIKECNLVPIKQGRRTFLDKAKLDQFAFMNKLIY